VEHCHRDIHPVILFNVTAAIPMISLEPSALAQMEQNISNRHVTNIAHDLSLMYSNKAARIQPEPKTIGIGAAE
jgi:hypothetical protein